MFIKLDENNRIIKISTQEFEGGIVFSFPENFDFTKHLDYLIVNDELVYDKFVSPTSGTVLPTPQEQTDALMLDHEERIIYLELGVNE